MKAKSNSNGEGVKYSKKLFINDLKSEALLQKEIKEVFFIRKVIKNVNGKTYLVIQLADRDGEMDGKMWADYIRDDYLHAENSFAIVTGTVGSYEGKPTLYITAMEPCKKLILDPAEFCKTVENIDQLYEEFVETYSEDIKKPHCLELLDKFYKNEALKKRFKELQGGKAYHHVTRGGYIQHVFSVYDYCYNEAADPVAKIIKSMKKAKKAGALPEDYDLQEAERKLREASFPNMREPLHEGFDMDILLTAAALHDVGKVKEYKSLPLNQRTEEGILIGHLTLTACMVYQAIREIPDFPKQDEIKLLHCIVTSHNGRSDLTDKLLMPQCLEAEILSNYDEEDARRDSFNEIIKNDDTEGTMTRFNVAYNRYFYKG